MAHERNFNGTPEERLARYTFKTRTCWFWIGCQIGNGYGVISVGSKRKLAHVLAWELRNSSPIPEGKEVMHGCDTRQCVNPDHLTVGTRKQNLEDSRNKGVSAKLAEYLKPICKYGHLRTTDNLYVSPTDGNRSCRTCRRLYNREHKRIARGFYLKEKNHG